GSGIADANNNVTITNTGLMTVTGGITETAGSGIGIFIKAGAGTLIIEGNSTYSGTTIVTAGTLALAHTGAAGTAGSGIIMTGGVLDLRSNAAGTTTFDFGTLFLGASATVNVDRLSTAGGVNNTIAFDTLDTQAFGVAGGTLTVNGGHGYGLRINNSVLMRGNLTISNVALVELAGGLQDTQSLYTGSGRFNFTKTGVGVLTISGASTYDGDTDIQVGTLVIKHDQALGINTNAINMTANSYSRILVDGTRTISRDITMGGTSTKVIGNLGTGTATFSGIITLNADAGNNFYADTGGTVVLGGSLIGTDPVNKTGLGTLQINGPSTGTGNPFSGTFTQAHGTTIGTAQSVGGSPFGFNNNLVVQSGAFQLYGLSGQSTLTQTTGSFTLGGSGASGASGANLIVRDFAVGADTFTTTFAIGSLTRANLGTGVFIPHQGNGEEILRIQTSPGLVNGILAPWLVKTTSDANRDADFVTLDGSNNVVTATYTSSDVNAANTNVSIVNDTDGGTLTATRNAYGLRLGADLDLDGNTLNIGEGITTGTFGGLILNNGADITGGTLNFGASEGLVYVEAGQTSTISATIAPFITGSGPTSNSSFNGLIKFGNGTLELSGSGVNGMRGSVYVNQGTLSLTASNVLPTYTFTNQIRGATLSVNSGATVNFNGNAQSLEAINSDYGSVINLGSATVTVGYNNQSSTLVGQITGTAGSTIIKVGTGTLTLSNTRGDVANSGLTNIFVDSGGLTIIAPSSSGSSSGTTQVFGAPFAVAPSLDISTNVILRGGSLNLRTDGDNTTSAESIDYGLNITVMGANSILTTDRAGQLGATAATKNILLGNLTLSQHQLTVTNTNTVIPIIRGTTTLTNDALINTTNELFLDGVILGGFSLNKSGGGNLFINNSANTFTGALVVNAGTLLFGTRGPDELRYAGQTFVPSDTARAGTGPIVINPAAIIRINDSGNIGSNQQLIVQSSTLGSASMVELRSDVALSTLNLRTFGAPTIALNMNDGFYQQNIDLARIGNGFGGLSQGSGGTATTNFTGTIGAGANNTYRFFGTNGGNFNIMNANALTGTASVEFGRSANILGSGPSNVSAFNYRFITDQDYTGSTIIHRTVGAGTVGGSVIVRGSLATSTIENYGILTLEGMGTFTNAAGTQVNTYIARPGSSLVLNYNTNINAGVFQPNGLNNAAAFVNKWQDNLGVVINGSQFQLTSTNGTTITEQVGAVTINQGAEIFLNSVNTNSQTVLLMDGAIVRNTGATLTIRTAGTSQLGSTATLGSRLMFVDPTTQLSGAATRGVVSGQTIAMVAPWIFNISDNTFVDYSPTNTTGFTAAAFTSTITAGGSQAGIGTGGTGIVDITTAAITALTATSDIYALRASQNITGTSAIQIRSGGVIINGTTVIDAPLTFNNGTSDIEAVLHTPSALTLANIITASGITKNGIGALTISGNNSTTLTAGELITVNGGTLQLNGGTTAVTFVPVAGKATVVLNGNYLNNNAAMMPVLQLRANGSTFFGTTAAAVDSINLTIGDNVPYAQISSDRSDTTSSNGTFTIGNLVVNAGTGTDGTILEFAQGNGYDFSVGGTTTLNGSAPVSFVINTSNNTDNIVTLTGAMSGSNRLIVTGNNSFLGSAILRLSAANSSFSGAITIAGGTLEGRNVSSFGNGTNRIELMQGQLNLRNDTNNATFATAGLTISGGSSIAPTRISVDRVSANNPNLNLGSAGATHRTENSAVIMFGQGNDVRLTFTGATFTVTDNPVFAQSNLNSIGASVFFDTIVQGSGHIIKTGGGTYGGTNNLRMAALVFNNAAANTFSGGLDVQGGGVRAGNATTKLGSGAITLAPGTQLDLADAGNVGGFIGTTAVAGVTKFYSNSTALATVSIRSAINVDPHSLLPASAVVSRSDVGGIFAIGNGVTYSTALDMSSLFNGMWFLGGGTGDGTYGATTLGVAADDVFRLGGGGGYLTLSAGTSLTDAGGTVAANRVLVGSPYSMAGGRGVIFAGDNSYSGGTTISRIRTTDLINGNLLGTQIAEVFVRGANASNLSTAITRAFGTGHVENYGLIQFDSVNSSAVNGFGVGAANVNTYSFHSGSRLLFANTGTQPDSRFAEGYWNDSTGVALRGSSIEFTGNDAPDIHNREVMGAVTFTAGSEISVRRENTGGWGELVLASLARVGSGTLTLDSNGGVAPWGGASGLDTTRLIVTTAGAAQTNTNGMVAAYIISRNGNQFVKYDSTNGYQLITTGGNPANYVAYTGASNTTILPSTLGRADQTQMLNDGTEIFDITGTGTNGENWTLGSNLDVWAFREGINGNANVVAGGATANTITIRGGGALFGNTGVNDQTWRVNLTFKDASNVLNEGLIYTGFTRNLTVEGIITAGSVTKFGSTALTLSQDNQVTGAWNLNEGVLQLTTPNALGFNNNVLNLNGAYGGQFGTAVPELRLNPQAASQGGEPFVFNMGATNAYEWNHIRLVGSNDRITQMGDLNLRTYSAGQADLAIPGIITMRVDGFRQTLRTGLVTLHDHYMLDIQSTSFGPGSTAAVQFGSGTAPVNQFNNQGLYDATKIGDGLLILGDNSGSFTNRTFTVNEGAVRVLHNGSFGAGSAKAIIDNGGALEIAVSNYVSTAALTQREGSIERWAVSNARASGYTFGSGVHWQLLTDVSSGTYNLNGGSLMGYLPVDFDETLVTRTIGSGVTLNLAASSFLGQPYVAGSDNSASAGGNGAALVGGNALQAFYDMGKGNRAGNTPLNPVFSGAYLRILGDITGAFDLTKVGQDVVLLGSSNNSYNNTIIREGVLQVGVNNALPVTKRLMTTANGILDLYGNNQTVGSLSGDGGSIRNSAITFNTLTVGGDNTSTSYTGVLSGNVALVKTGTGTLTLGTSATSGFTNDYAGGTTVTGGTLSISADINLGFVPLTAATGLNNLILNGGTLATTATMTLSSTRGFQVGASGGSLNVASGTVLSYAGAATGTGTLTKKGLGTYSVSGNTALSGGLDIQQGAVQVSGSTTASTNTATSGALTVSGGAVLTVSDPNTGDAFTTTATFGSLARSGRGTLTFVPANNSLNVQEFLAFTTPPTTTNGIIAPWAVRAFSSGSSAGDFLGLSAGNVVTATYTSTDITSSTSTDVVNQTTAAALSGAAQAYALKLTSSSIAMAGNTLTLGDGTFAGLILNGGAGLTNGTLALSTGEGLVYVDSAADSTIQATITGSNGLTKFGAGRLILSGNNTYTGTTNVNQGTLLLNGTTRTYGPNPTNPLASAGGSNLGASSSLTVLNGAAVEFFDDVDIFIGGSPVAINLAGTGVSGNGALRYRGNADPFNRGSGDVTGNVNGVITLTDATRIQSDAGTLRLNGAINAAGFDLTLGGLGNIRVAGVLALGTGGLTKDGTGTLELRGNNTYSGDTTVSAGIVALSHANGLGSTGGATTVATGAVLAINGVSTSENIFINGTGLASSGALVGNGNVTTPILSEVSGNVTMASASSIGVLQGGILTISGVLGDNGGNVAFSKVGAGTLILSGANTYEGATSVLLGTLQLSGSGRISNNATTVLQGTLDLNGISQGIQTLTLGGLVTDGSLTSLLNIGAGGSLALGGDVTVTYAANTSNEGAQITAGTLNLGFGNRTFTVGDSFFAETDLLVSSVIAGGNSDVGIIKAGGGIFGVMKVTGTNTFGGSVQINAGILEFSTASNLGVGNLIVFNTVANNTGRLRFASGNTTDISTRTLRFLGAGNALVDTNGNNVIFANPIGDYGPGGLTKLGTGTLTLQGANTYSGTTNVQGGTLILSGANGAVDAASNLTLANGAALTLDNTTSNNTDRIVGTLTSTGGVFNFNHGGAASTNYREEFGALTLTTGQTTFNLSQAAASQTSVVTTLSGARTAGATAMFAGTGLGTDTRNQFVFTTIPTLQNGVLPWAVVNSGSLISLATGASGTSLAPLALAAHNQGSETTWVAASNARPTADVTVTAARSLNTLTLDNGIDLLAPLADRTITFATLGTVLQTGGSSIIGASGTNEHVLAFGTAEAIFYTIGDLVIQRGDTGNITGSGGMTKAGAGTLTIAQNAVTGTVRLNEGTYRALGTQATAFGNGTVTFDGGSAILEADGGVNYARAVTALRDATITVQRTTAGAGITHTLGTLAVGVANQLYPVTLTIAEGTSINNDTAYGVTFGNVTLATYTNLVINDNGTGKGTVTTGTIGGAFTLAKQGSGDLALNGAATSNIDIQEGRVVLGTVATQDARVLGGLGGVAKITGTTTLNGGTAS
ncbi:MAG: autotransporter-associated beta strand repeat-containing protein, partial [Roseimicrobium sp.]